jgi:hypothetical protein
VSWDKGADRIDELVARGFLQRVPASPQAAHLLIADARRHLQSAETIADADPQGAYALTYDAARKAMAAVLEAQGLRATSAGGHVVLYDAAIAQFEPPLGHLFRPFNRMRVRRNQVEYASTDNPPITADEVRRDVIRTRRLVEDFALPAIELVSGGR